LVDRERVTSAVKRVIPLPNRGRNNTWWISLSAADPVAVIAYATKKEIAYLPVGDHPLRVRQGVVPEAVVARWSLWTPRRPRRHTVTKELLCA